MHFFNARAHSRGFNVYRFNELVSGPPLQSYIDFFRSAEEFQMLLA